MAIFGGEYDVYCARARRDLFPGSIKGEITQPRAARFFPLIGRIRPRRQVEHYPRLGVELPEFAAR